MKTDGGCWAAVIARTRAPVACMRLSRMAALRAAVQRPPAIETPARLIDGLGLVECGGPGAITLARRPARLRVRASDAVSAPAPVAVESQRRR